MGSSESLEAEYVTNSHPTDTDNILLGFRSSVGHLFLPTKIKGSVQNRGTWPWLLMLDPLRALTRFGNRVSNHVKTCQIHDQLPFWCWQVFWKTNKCFCLETFSLTDWYWWGYRGARFEQIGSPSKNASLSTQMLWCMSLLLIMIILIS